MSDTPRLAPASLEMDSIAQPPDRLSGQPEVRVVIKRLSSPPPTTEGKHAEQSLSRKRHKPDYAYMFETLCRHCEGMTSSQNGVQSLVSETGYEHKTRSEIKASAEYGCTLCGIIMRSAATWSMSERLVFFAYRDNHRLCHRLALWPAMGLKFDELCGYRRSGKPASRIITLVAMTWKVSGNDMNS